MSPAIFLDRDGVLIKDVGLLTDPENIEILPGVPAALSRLQAAGLKLVVVSNQAVVARGLATKSRVEEINLKVELMIGKAGGPEFDAVYYCPHHTNATLAEYRIDCECRKPKPGMLLQAAREHGLDLGNSFMVGDRITDIIAGSRAGCRTVLVQTGAHLEPPIQTKESLDLNIKADFECRALLAAVDWILER